MRIVHYNKTWLSQTATWLYNQVRYLPDEVENHIVCERTENLEQFEMPNIHALSSDRLGQYMIDRILRAIRMRSHFESLVHELSAIDPDLLHSHFGFWGWRNLPAAQRARVPHLVTFYGVDLGYYPNKDPRWRGRYQELFETVDGVLCEGEAMAESIRDLGCPDDKVRVHHLGIPVETIDCQPRTFEPEEPLRILMAASFREKKGLPYALEAIGRIKNDIPVEVTLIGDVDSSDGSKKEGERIWNTIGEWDLAENVRHLGYQPHDVLMEEAYAHHIFLSPSVTAANGDREGGVPVTIIEMAATGMPIVSTHHCDIPAVVLDGESGLLAPERDVDALVNHLRYLARHPDEWQEMAERGRSHIEKEYSCRVQGERLAGIYREVVG